jgi:CheY-like chemotaxis protein
MTAKVRVLMVDDEANVLAGYRRTLGRKYDVVTAEGGQAALAALANSGPFPVVFTDMRMPGMDGVEFLTAARAAHRDCVYVMITGNADQQTAIDAINRGQVFRFLNKPCTTEMLESTVEACLRQHELIHAERVLTRDTLSGAVRMLVEAILLSDPALAGVSAVVRRDARRLAHALGLAPDWRFPLAASLCLVGCVLAPDGQNRRDLSDDCLAAGAAAGGTLLRHIPRLEEVAAMVARQREPGPLPPSLDSADPALRQTIGARLLRFCVDFARSSSAGDRRSALRVLSTHPEPYDPRILAVAEACLLETSPADGTPAVTRTDLDVRLLQAGMIADQDILTAEGIKLVSKGFPLSEVVVERLKGFARAKLIPSHLRVLIDTPGADPGAAAQAA